MRRAVSTRARPRRAHRARPPAILVRQRFRHRSAADGGGCSGSDRSGDVANRASRRRSSRNGEPAEAAAWQHGLREQPPWTPG